MDINKKLDDLYDKFCDWYEDDGSHDEQIKAKLKSEILKLIQDNYVPNAELKPFLYWVFHTADKIYVEHTLGWRDNAIEEMIEAYKRSIKKS